MRVVQEFQGSRYESYRSSRGRGASRTGVPGVEVRVVQEFQGSRYESYRSSRGRGTSRTGLLAVDVWSYRSSRGPGTSRTGVPGVDVWSYRIESRGVLWAHLTSAVAESDKVKLNMSMSIHMSKKDVYSCLLFYIDLCPPV